MTIHGEVGVGVRTVGDHPEESGEYWKIRMRNGWQNAHVEPHSSETSTSIRPVFWRMFQEADVGGKLYPQPLKPLHVKNLSNVDMLEAQGWAGSDVSLSISLFEYRFAWRYIHPHQSKDGDELLIIFGLAGNRFGRCAFKRDLDVRKEWGWAFGADDKLSFLSTIGCTEQQFDELELHEKINSLYHYFGVENIFGSGKYGFQIAPDSDMKNHG